MDKNQIDRRAFLGVAAAGVGLAETGSLASPLVDAGDVVMPREFEQAMIACGVSRISYVRIFRRVLDDDEIKLLARRVVRLSEGKTLDAAPANRID